MSLLSDMESYWTPDTVVETSDETKAATAYTGDVKDAAVLGHNDEIVQSINAAGSADQTQAHRALIDADYDWKQTLPDSLGPVLGGWFSEGVADGSLPLTTAWIDEVGEGADGGQGRDEGVVEGDAEALLDLGRDGEQAEGVDVEVVGEAGLAGDGGGVRAGLLGGEVGDGGEDVGGLVGHGVLLGSGVRVAAVAAGWRPL